MDAREAIRRGLQGAENIVKVYLGDMSDGELLVRPVPGANHIAWQLGHLIASENQMMETALPGSMPGLPQGFAEKHAADKATFDEPSAFLKKDEYLRLYDQQRAATLRALEKTTNEALDQPAPEAFRAYAEKLADVFTLHGNHWMMHAGQWAVVRRKLGRKPLF